MKSSDHQQQAAKPPRNAHPENASPQRASEDDSKGVGNEWVASTQVETGQEGTGQEEAAHGGGQSLGDRVMISIGTAVIGMNGGATGISLAGWLIHMRGWSHEMVGELSIVLASLLALVAAVLFWGGPS